jgi:hypothetical protein
MRRPVLGADDRLRTGSAPRAPAARDACTDTRSDVLGAMLAPAPTRRLTWTVCIPLPHNLSNLDASDAQVTEKRGKTEQKRSDRNRNVPIGTATYSRPLPELEL